MKVVNNPIYYQYLENLSHLFNLIGILRTQKLNHNLFVRSQALHSIPQTSRLILFGRHKKTQHPFQKVTTDLRLQVLFQRLAVHKHILSFDFLALGNVVAAHFFDDPLLVRAQALHGLPEALHHFFINERHFFLLDFWLHLLFQYFLVLNDSKSKRKQFIDIFT